MANVRDVAEGTLVALVAIPFIGLGAACEVVSWTRVRSSKVLSGAYNATIGTLTGTHYTPAKLQQGTEDRQEDWIERGYISRTTN